RAYSNHQGLLPARTDGQLHQPTIRARARAHIGLSMENRVRPRFGVKIVARRRTGSLLSPVTSSGVCDSMTLEYCRLVVDRPPFAGQHGLVYVAETVGPGAPRIVATSPVFHPDIDPEASAAARATLVALLIANGWEPVPDQPPVLVGERF